MKKKTIENDKILLRPISEGDTDNIINWRNKEEVKRNFIYKDDFTRESHLNWLNNYVYTGKCAQFIIVDKLSNLDVGSIYLRDIDEVEQQAEFGIFLGCSNNFNKGYGSNSIPLIIDFGFNQLKLKTIYLRVLESNVRAIHTYQKLGFMIDSNYQVTKDTKDSLNDVVFMSISNK